MRQVRAPAKDLLSKGEVCSYLEIGRDALDELITERRFPGPLQITRRTQRWKWEWVVGYLWGLDMAHYLIPPSEARSADSAVLGGPGGDSTVSGGKRRSNTHGS